MNFLLMTSLCASRLKNRNMNKVYTGGLGSYALACSVIGYFNVGCTALPVGLSRTDVEKIGAETRKSTKGD